MSSVWFSFCNILPVDYKESVSKIQRDSFTYHCNTKNKSWNIVNRQIWVNAVFTDDQ